jgi:peptide/nickel transport system permease protein
VGYHLDLMARPGKRQRRGGLIRFVASRILTLIPTFVLVSAMTFLLFELAPGDPAVVAAGGADASEDVLEATRERLGLNEPVVVRYAEWLGDIMRGDLGTSFVSGLPVMDLIAARAPTTIALTLAAMIVAAALALPAGTVAAAKPSSWVDRMVTTGASLGMALPEFFLGMVLVLFLALRLSLFPAGGYAPFFNGPAAWLSSITLPALTLGFGAAAELTRYVRSGLRAVLGRDYIVAHHAKGLSRISILLKHGLRNAAIPIVTVVGLQIRRLLGGAVIVEQVFNVQGVGQLAIRAVQSRDLPLILGIAVVAAITVMVVNMLVDLTYPLLDPRVRDAGFASA